MEKVPFQQSLRGEGVRPILGTEVRVSGMGLPGEEYPSSKGFSRAKALRGSVPGDRANSTETGQRR